MNKDQFASRWADAERGSGSILWSFYASGYVTSAFLFVAGVVGLLAGPLFGLAPAELRGWRFVAWIVVAFSILTFVILKFAMISWQRWLKTNGLICLSCGHIFNSHVGTYLTPPQPDLCTVCAAGGACRRTPVTGKCDRCGTVIFEP